jgi:hypothetical protein
MVSRVTACEQVRTALDLPEVRELATALDATKWTGRPGYPTIALIGMCLIRHVYALPAWSMTAGLVAEHRGLQDVLGCCPSVYACYRFTGRLRRHHEALDDCLTRLVARVTVGEHLALDASDMPAWANGQRFVRKGGPLRERYSDPDASWGHRSAVSTRGHGGFYGYKLHLAVCTETELPVAWEVRTARDQESPVALPLLDQAMRRGVSPLTVAMDKGYDQAFVYEGCVERGCLPVIPLRKVKGGGPARLAPVIGRDTEEFTVRYRGRSSVERAFGRLKHHRGLSALRARRLARVQLHAELAVLATLASAAGMRARG